MSLIKLKRGLASEWAALNPILSLGEPGWEKDTGKLKIGDGVTPWNSLPYLQAENNEDIILQPEDVEQVISDVLVAGTGISLDYNDSNDTLTINSNLQTELIAGNNIQLTYDSGNDTLSIGTVLDPTFDKIQLDLTADPLIEQGQIGWDEAEGTLDLGLENNVSIHVGEHNFFRIRNNTANVLYAGQAVYANDVHNNILIEASPYTADGSIREIRFIGLVLKNIDINQKGYAINFGHIENLDTRGNGAVNGAQNLYAADEPAWVEGDILYVHPTIPGKLTKIEPKHSISAAIVLYVHQNNGRIFVRPTSYGHLDDNHNVDVSGLANDQFLVYDSATDYWKPSVNLTYDDRIMRISCDCPENLGGYYAIADGHIANFRANQFFDGSVEPPRLIFRRSRGTQASPVIANSGDGIFAIRGETIDYSGNVTILGGLRMEITDPASPTSLNPGANIFLRTSSGGDNVLDKTLMLNSDGVLSNTGPIECTHLDVASTGDIGTLKIDNFYHQNLAVATGIADSDLMIAIIDPTGSPTTEVIQGSVLRSSLLNQPAQLQFRQGTDAERLLITPASGEPIWTTDTQKFYIGDGSTTGGDFIGPSPYDRGDGTQSIVALNNGCVASGNYSVIGGGQNNTTSGTESTVGGGSGNDAIGETSTVGGGGSNTASGNRSTVGGGGNNTASNGYTTVGGGASNTASDYYSTVGGGSVNTASGYNSTVGGGFNNTASGYRSTVGGGFSNAASGYSTTVSGGQNNTASGNYSAIGGGKSNTALGSYSAILGGRFNQANVTHCCVVGGLSNIASGNYSMVGGGAGNTSSGSYGVALGGRDNKANGNYSCVSGGWKGKATRHGEISHAAGRFAQDADAQHTILIARRTTSDATANQVLFLDGSSQRLTIPAATMWTFEVKLSAYNDADHEGAWWIIRGGIISNDGGDVALVGSLITENGADSSLSTASASVVADDTNDALEIRVTGVAGRDIRWVAVVDISQVSYGTP